MGRPRLSKLIATGGPAAGRLVDPTRRLGALPRGGAVIQGRGQRGPQRIVWSLEDGTVVHERDVAFLNRAPASAADLARALAETLTTSSRRATVDHTIEALRYGLSAWLAAEGPLTRIEALAPEHVERLVGFLESRPGKAGSAAESTSHGRYSTASRLLRSTGKLTFRIRPNPFAADGEKDALTPARLRDILKAAAAMALRTIALREAEDDPGHRLWNDPVEGPAAAACGRCGVRAFGTSRRS